MGQITELYRRAIRKFDRVWTQKRVSILWPIVTHIPGWRGTKAGGEELLIVSLTSFPARIHLCSEAIKSLLLQEKKPNRLLLWLAVEQFPNKENDLPTELLELKRFGLEICWCNDIRSHKKLIPALKQYLEAAIVTADDDLYYRRNWLKILYNEYLKHPELICSHRIAKFFIRDGSYTITPGSHEVWEQPSFLNRLGGGSGTLFPPHTLYKDIADAELFMRLCPTNDDIWFWLMAVLNGTKVYAPEAQKDRQVELVYVPGTQEGPTLCSINNEGEKLFWKDFERVLAYYPELDAILKKEYERLSEKEQ